MKKFLLLASAATAFVFAASDVKIPFEKYKLTNGMRVVLSRDSSVPVVAVYVIYDVGARAEEKGRTGFAHLFEHMMFQGSSNVPKGEHFKYVESNGGSMNGSTHPDYTDYYETMPSNKLNLALWLESDRMRSLAITADNLKNQQEAVKQERRLSFDNQPYATAIVDRWPTIAYSNFQNSHSLIGSFEDLNAASVEDVSRFFKTYYAPNNAVLVISGDFQPADAKKLVQQYFGDIAAQPQPKRPDMTEPERAEGRMEAAADPHARVPAVIIGWPGPKRHSPDWYAINMLDAVLTSGQSSRLQLNLVKGKQSLLQFESNLGWPFGSPQDYKDPNVYAVNLTYKPNFTAKQIVDQYQAEIDRIVADGVAPNELERVKTVLRYNRAASLQSALSRAQMLAIYELIDGNPAMYESDFAAQMRVTSAEIQTAAKKYLVAARRDVLAIQPAPAEGGAK
ncbi:MAG: family peptidase [Bryobacterales bacterium]|nr:family peptidase [Bryobacterales bacterium]